MFEKEAKEYATENYENCLYDNFPYTNDSKAIEKSFKEGAEFGYNKAIEACKKLLKENRLLWFEDSVSEFIDEMEYEFDKQLKDIGVIND